MYKVDLEVFQGPLDLLLHLIEKMEIDIHNVSILKLTESYLDYIHSVDEISLNNAEEYIVMASSLIHMKSKSLLPKENNYDEEIFDEDTLVQQLIEYKNYKELCSKFEDLRISRDNFGEKEEEELNLNYKLNNMQADILYRSIKRVLSEIDFNREDNIRINYRKEVSLEKIKDITINYIKKNKKILLDDLIKMYDTRSEIIASFLSVLDLVSKGIIKCTGSEEKVYLEI